MHNRRDRFPYDLRGKIVNDIRTKVATGATILGLGALAGYALHTNDPASRAAEGVPAAAHVRPKVRTQTIRRTIHVRPHPKSQDAAATSPPAAAPPTPPSQASAPAPAPAPAVRAAPVSAPAPVATRTSGAAGSPASSFADDEGDDAGESEEADD